MRYFRERNNGVYLGDESATREQNGRPRALKGQDLRGKAVNSVLVHYRSGL